MWWPATLADSGAASYGATTPALGLVFHANDSVNLYGAIGRGFETPRSMSCPTALAARRA